MDISTEEYSALVGVQSSFIWSLGDFEAHSESSPLRRLLACIYSFMASHVLTELRVLTLINPLLIYPA